MKLKKSKKITLVMSLSLGLAIPTWTASAVEIENIMDKTQETGQFLSAATAYGLTSQGSYSAGTDFEVTVKALSGTNPDGAADAYAYGIFSSGSITAGDTLVKVTAMGGNGNTYSNFGYGGATANGISNNGTLTTKNNTIEVTSIWGATDHRGVNYAFATGMVNYANGTLTTENNKITVTATGGKGSSSSSLAGSNTAGSNTVATGLSNTNIMTTKKNTITVTATGGEAEHTGSGNAGIEAKAYGIQNTAILTTTDNTIAVTAIGGKSVNSGMIYSTNTTEVRGIWNQTGTLTTGNNAIIATAIGGEISTGNSRSSDSATASGIFNTRVLITEDNTITVIATGGKSSLSSYSTSAAFAQAEGYGIVSAGTLTTKNNTIVVTAVGGEAVHDTGVGYAEASAYAYGIYGRGMLSTGDNTITVKAIGGESSSGSSGARDYTRAYGIQNDNSLSTGNNVITSTVIAGKVSSNPGFSDARATAYGISNDGTMSTKNNIVVATATGGHDSSTDSATDAYVRAYGISNNSTLTTEGNTITVTATGGEIVPNPGNESAIETAAFGIQNSGTLNTKENTIRAIATGGTVVGTTATSETTAVGMYSKSNGNLTAVGSQNIYTEAVAGTANGVLGEAYAYALLAESDGAIILDSQGEAVKLTGDIGVNGSGMITVSLDNTDSIWRPRLQDTYGSAETGSFGSGSFTMQDGGVLDLAWHSNLNGYNFKDSQLNLTGDTIQIGNGATFIVNADLANNVADTISANTTATGTQYVRVAYDPSYLTYETVEGRALVLDFDGANGMGLASTVERPGSDVTFMPIMEGGYLVSLKRTEEPGIVGKTVSASYQQQINILRTQWSNLVQRLGDVRNENPESHNGSWARIHGGKLKSNGAYGRNSTMKYGGVQAGYDRMRETGSGKYLAGFLVDYIDADSDFQRGEGNTQSLAFGGYWTWLSPKGHYADVVVKAAHLDTDYDFYYLSGEKASADFTNWGYTMSVEYGYRHDLKKNRYIEPQAQFLVGHLESKNYRSSNGVSLHQDGVNLAMGRLGVLMGWTDENKSSAYIRGSVVHDFSGSGALTSSYEGARMRIDTAGNTGTTFEVNMGASVIVGKNSHLYAELTKSFGGDVKTDWQANLGWRVKW